MVCMSGILRGDLLFFLCRLTADLLWRPAKIESILILSEDETPAGEMVTSKTAPAVIVEIVFFITVGSVLLHRA